METAEGWAKNCSLENRPGLLFLVNVIKIFTVNPSKFTLVHVLLSCLAIVKSYHSPSTTHSLAQRKTNKSSRIKNKQNKKKILL